MTETPNVAGAVEASAVASPPHPLGAFDVADHPVPTGREEIWRFTPMKRLRNLHGDAELVPGGAVFQWNTPEGVRAELVEGEESRTLRGVSGLVPNTRYAARVLAESPSTLLVDVAANTEVTEPVLVDVKGQVAD